MDNSKMNASNINSTDSLINRYSNRVFRLVVLIVPAFFILGNIAMTIMHYIGWYPAINDIAMWISNAVDIFYLAFAVYLIKMHK